MNFERPMTIVLSGREVALIVAQLGEVPAKFSHELIKRFEALDAEADLREQLANHPATPQLRMVSQTPEGQQVEDALMKSIREG